MTFAQALARIEELTKEIEQIERSGEHAHNSAAELRGLLYRHADSIVQLGKVAKEMADKTNIYTGQVYEGDDLIAEYKAYDKLMNGEEG
jgi:hypothetical protein